MKIGELIAELQTLDPETEVVANWSVSKQQWVSTTWITELMIRTKEDRITYDITIKKTGRWEA